MGAARAAAATRVVRPGLLASVSPARALSVMDKLNKLVKPGDKGNGESEVLSFGNALQIAQITLMQLDNPQLTYAKTLDAIKNASDMNLSEKWQAMIHVFLYGFSADDNGLRSFTTEFEKLSRMHPEKAELQKITTQRWRVLIERTFGLKFTEGDAISLTQARHISSIMALKMQSDDFLQKIDKRIATLGAKPDHVDRQRAILEELLPLQLEVMQQFGYKGDEGYVRMQLALVEHSGDDQMSYNTAASMLAVFRRAGIDLSKM